MKSRGYGAHGTIVASADKPLGNLLSIIPTEQSSLHCLLYLSANARHFQLNAFDREDPVEGLPTMLQLPLL